MFLAYAALFSSLFEFAIGVGVVVLIWHIFVSDWVKSIRAKTNESKAQFSVAEKMAQVKLVSDDPKDIEKFIEKNAAYLPIALVGKLVDRITYLRADQYLTAEDNLKARIADLKPIRQSTKEEVLDELEEEETNAKAARS